VEETADAVSYRLQCHDQNTLLFRNPWNVDVIVDSRGARIGHSTEGHDDYGLVHFSGRGRFTVIMKKGRE
jgi:hypothetical protein